MKQFDYNTHLPYIKQAVCKWNELVGESPKNEVDKKVDNEKI